MSILQKIKDDLEKKEYDVFSKIQEVQSAQDDTRKEDRVQNPILVNALGDERYHIVEAISQVADKVLKQSNPEISKFLSQTVLRLKENLDTSHKIIVEGQ